MKENIENPTITLYDEGEAIEVKMIASFTFDEKEYCWLEDPETKDPVLFRAYPDEEDMVFQIVEDDKEYEEADAAYREILQEERAELNKES